ncbi:hypothetical protein [Arvimicrobium flavum]|uniref:hypothetical protein n=1 Tax=Arvimicrobium flavum TaxID=3393320 RepID=UPI00237C50F5|nr:hypothetical protein [Mesorhizobium shangrilense]
MTEQLEDTSKPSRLAVAFGQAAPYAVCAGLMGVGAAVGIAPVAPTAAAVSAVVVAGVSFVQGYRR